MSVEDLEKRFNGLSESYKTLGESVDKSDLLELAGELLALAKEQRDEINSLNHMYEGAIITNVNYVANPKRTFDL